MFDKQGAGTCCEVCGVRRVYGTVKGQPMLFCPDCALAELAATKAQRDELAEELNRLTRGDVSNVITTLGDALTYIASIEAKLERALKVLNAYSTDDPEWLTMRGEFYDFLATLDKEQRHD